MKMNTAAARYPAEHTHEGARAERETPIALLTRLVNCCLLWEDTFYVDGKTIADQIVEAAARCRPDQIAELAVLARHTHGLRHAPLLLARYLATVRGAGTIVRQLLPILCDRPDQIAEFMAIYWAGGKTPIAAAVKKGLAASLANFNEYTLAKYDRGDAKIHLRDVAFLVHAKPAKHELEGSVAMSTAIVKPGYRRGAVLRHPNSLLGKLVDGKLETPDTWEVELSRGADKRATFERLMHEGKLGALAFIRNLRNMVEAGIPVEQIEDYGNGLKWHRVWPWQLITAARMAPSVERGIDHWLQASVEKAERLPGKTLILVDVSGSMDGRLSGKGQTKRIDAATGLAVLFNELSETTVTTFSNQLIEVPPRRGLALRDAIVHSQNHGGTYLSHALDFVRKNARTGYDRTVVITDEQSADGIGLPLGRGYLVNVAGYQNGVDTGGHWLRVSGWSSGIVNFIRAVEGLKGIEARSAEEL